MGASESPFNFGSLWVITRTARELALSPLQGRAKGVRLRQSGVFYFLAPPGPYENCP
jgi:hypothetical protein